MLYKWNCVIFVILPKKVDKMEVINELMHDVFSMEITQTGAVFRLFVSLLLGSMIGYERRTKGQKAGLRTFALISMGSTLAMILSIYVAGASDVKGDPTRIAAQVVSGIGFLGAGAIIQMKGSVRGLTTAAGIWVTAAIGMVVATGMYVLAVLSTLCVLFVLSLLETYEQKANFSWSSKIVRVKMRGIVTSSQVYLDVFEKFNVHVNDTYLKFDYESNYTIANFVILAKTRTDFSELFVKMGTLNDTLSITLTNEISN